MNTFHFHDSSVRDFLDFSLLLSLNPGLIVLVRGNYDYGLAYHALEGPDLTSLRVGIDVRLDGGKKNRKLSKPVRFGSKSSMAFC